MREKDGGGGVKGGRKRKGKGKSCGKVAKRVEMSHTPATRLAMEFEGLEIQSPSSMSFGF